MGEASVGGGTGSQLEDSGDRGQPVDEPIGVGDGVVDRVGGAGGGRRAQAAHERLGAVMAGADAHPLAAEDLPDVVRVGAVDAGRVVAPLVNP